MKSSNTLVHRLDLGFKPVQLGNLIKIPVVTINLFHLLPLHMGNGETVFKVDHIRPVQFQGFYNHILVRNFQALQVDTLNPFNRLTLLSGQGVASRESILYRTIRPDPSSYEVR